MPDNEVNEFRSHLETFRWTFDYKKNVTCNLNLYRNNWTSIEWKTVNESIARKCKIIPIETLIYTLDKSLCIISVIILTDKLKPYFSPPGKYLFHGQGMKGSKLSEGASGAILLVCSLAILCLCLILMVKTLSALMKGPLAGAIKKTINAEFPGKFAFLTGYLAILIGAGLTILVQSSSVFTSMLTPLVGLGIVRIERVYPLELGANVGTTGTAILAALASTNVQKSMHIALTHCFFNIFGLLLFYPIPFTRKIPIGMAKYLGDVTAEYRWFAIAYLIIVFIVVPGSVFGLSIPGWGVLLGVGAPIIVLIIAIIVLNVLQNKKPDILPKKLRTWEFLPKPLRSLEPYDTFFFKRCPCSKKVENLETVEMAKPTLEAEMKEPIATISNGTHTIPNGIRNDML